MGRWLPVLGVDGKAPDTLNIPITTNGLGNIVTSDEFSRKHGELSLPLAFQWNHNPDDRYWSITERLGFLRLKTFKIVSELPEARNTLTQRTFGPDCFGTVAVDVSNMKDGDYTGLAVFQKKYGFVGVKMSEGTKSIVMVSAESNSPVEIQNVPLDKNTVFSK
jgi:beta-xylosidase